MSGRPEAIERPCDVCEQWDRSPRHHHIDDDGKDIIRHLDCCEAVGCPSGDHPGACPNLLPRVGRKKDDELRTALQNLGPLDFADDPREARRIHALRADVTDDHLEQRLAALPKED